MEKIVGYVLAQATTKSFEIGKSVVNFRIVENRSVPDGEGGYKKAARFFECSYWVGPGIAPHLVKGKLVAVEGIIGVRAYINSHNGEALGILTLYVQHIELYGPAQKNNDRESDASEASDEPQF